MAVFSADKGVSLFVVAAVVGTELGGLEADGAGAVSAQAAVKSNASRMEIMLR